MFLKTKDTSTKGLFSSYFQEQFFVLKKKTIKTCLVQKGPNFFVVFLKPLFSKIVFYNSFQEHEQKRALNFASS